MNKLICRLDFGKLTCVQGHLNLWVAGEVTHCKSTEYKPELQHGWLPEERIAVIK